VRIVVIEFDAGGMKIQLHRRQPLPRVGCDWSFEFPRAVFFSRLSIFLRRSVNSDSFLPMRMIWRLYRMGIVT